MADKKYTMEEIAQMQKVFGQKDLIFPHGDAGLLRDGSVRPDMASAIPTHPGAWSASVLPMRSSIYADQIVEIFTGKTADTGTNPSGTCETPPRPGNLKTAQQNFRFGLFHKGTEQFNIVNVNERAHHADMDRRFINVPALNNPLMPQTISLNPEAVNTPMGKLHWEFGHNVILDWTRPAWQGQATRTAAQTHLGWINEFNGLEQQISTGKTDNATGFAAPSIDSVVVSYNAVIGADVVAELSNLYRRLKSDATLVNMSGTAFHIVIHPRMEYALYDNWSCNYNTARCEPDATNGRRLNVETSRRLLDEFMQNKYLLIDGERVPVYTDFGVGLTLDQSTGQFTSDVFIVPVNWAGRPLVYWEFKPFNGQEMAEVLSAPGVTDYEVINNGLYLVTKVNTRTCIEWQYNAKARIILDYPFLAGRLDDVIVPGNVANQFNDPFTSEFYHANGGTMAR